MTSCPAGHLFCSSCVGKSTEIAVGQAKGKVACLNADCSEIYSLANIKRCVDPETFSHLVRRCQQEEIREADIKNLVFCPYCDYASIIDDETVTVFRCLNPSCMRESCRWVLIMCGPRVALVRAHIVFAHFQENGHQGRWVRWSLRNLNNIFSHIRGALY